MTCPRCGNKDAHGKFCSNCGGALSGAACTRCGKSLAAGAKFCNACGQAVGGGTGTPSGVPSWLPWAVGAAMAAGLVIAAILMMRPPQAPSGEAATPASGTTDISQMSPRERANRLFDRVMRLQEAGDTAQVRFFAPMAIQAHQMMGDLDADARYHLGLLYLANGDTDAARLQGDSILAGVPTHLYGFMLRAQASRAAGDTRAARTADQAFLQHFSAESAANRVEYQEHPGLIDRYRTEAQNRN